MNTEEIILAYWKSWQGHDNWERTRSYMCDDVHFDAGAFQTQTADQLIALMKRGNPWKDIQLLDTVMGEENKGALIYEGTDSVSGTRMRIAEIITVCDEKIARCITTIAALPESGA